MSGKNDKTTRVKTDSDQWLCIDVPPIIDEETFQAARERAKHNFQQAQRNTRNFYLFRGMLRCNKCKSACIGGPHRKHIYYQCHRTQRTPIRQCDMPTFNEAAIDAVVWPWIKEITTNFEKVEQVVLQHQRESDEHNARLHSLIAVADRLIAEKKAERDRVFMLYKKNKLDEERWEVEDTVCQREIAAHEADRQELAARLVMQYTPEYLADVKVTCEAIGRGFEHFTSEEKRNAYELLDLSIRLAVEDGYKIAHAECVIDAKRLVISKPGAIVSPPSRL